MEAFSADLPEIWNQGDLVAHATLLILLAMSAASWTVLAVRLIEQFRLLRQATAACKALDGALAVESFPAGSPFHRIALTGFDALRRHDCEVSDAVDRHTWLSLALHRALARSLGEIQGGLAMLATIASTAPFVGLFGTVWGIHRALGAISASGQASIDKVAGPVGEALVMTALGLAVAVPAVLAYNWLGRRNRLAVDSLRDFTAGLHALLLAHRLNERSEAAPPFAARLAVRTV